MAEKFLNLSGLNTLWAKLKSTFAKVAHSHSASDITSGTFGTSRIADDAITAAKVKDNETLPVSIIGAATSLKPSASIKGGNTNTYAWRRVAYTGELKRSYIDKYLTLLIRRTTSDSTIGIIKIYVRTNLISNANGSVGALWLVRGNDDLNVKVAMYQTNGLARADVFLKAPAYPRYEVINLGTKNDWTFFDSNEGNDAATRTNAYATIEDAAQEIYGVAYTSIKDSSDIGIVKTISKTLPISKGGTGATTAKAAEYNLHPNNNTHLAGDLLDDYRIPFLSTEPSDSNGVFEGYRKLSQIWNYIQSKIYSVLGLTKDAYGGKAASATSADSATKATADANGNNIANTYATKTELNDYVMFTEDEVETMWNEVFG